MPRPREVHRDTEVPWSRWVAAVAAVQFAVLVATSTRYGYHRDELYFIVAGSHPAFGYPDQPPLVPLLCWAMNALSPGSLLLLRLPSAVVAAATTVVASLVARELGGGRRAQIVAALCTATSGFALAVGHFVTTTTFDLLSTTLFGWLVIRAVVRRRAELLVLAGLVVGTGVEAKPQVGLVAAVVVVALVLVGPRSLLRTRWAALGVAAAALIAAPYVIWQQQHGWPQLTVAHNIAGSAEGGRAGFIPFQLVMVSVFFVPVWVAGLMAPFRRPGLRELRFVPLSYALLALAYLAGNGKAYYLASMYPLLLGVGALPTADWMTRRRHRPRLFAAAALVSAAISGLLALPLLPVRDLQGSIVMKINPDQGETVGWPRFVETVDRAWLRVPARERSDTAIFTANYGEAAAIDLLGAARGLPRSYSGQTGFTNWGVPSETDRDALVVGYGDGAAAAPAFDRCRVLATVDDGVGLDNDEQGLPLMLCRVTAPWAVLWPTLRHYD